MADTTKLSTVGQAKATVLAEIGNETTQKELVTTVFKGLDIPSMKRAVLEGHLRGFKFKDFLEKNVYAIPFGGGYSLVTSIDYARKRGMKGGIVGTDKPIYTLDEDDKIISCEVTVKKMFDGGHVGEFTAEVFFSEFNTGKQQWASKPHVMISKVAEMHALRKACPDELSQAYAEEEFEKDHVAYEVIEPDVDDAEVKKVVKKINAFKKLDTLQTYYTELGKPMILEQEVIDSYENAKNKLSDTE